MDWSYSGIAGARRAQAYEGEVTLTPLVKHYPPDTHAASLWLRNRQSKRWRDRIEHTGADGGPISLETILLKVAERERAQLEPPTIEVETGSEEPSSPASSYFKKPRVCAREITAWRRWDPLSECAKGLILLVFLQPHGPIPIPLPVFARHRVGMESYRPAVPSRCVNARVDSSAAALRSRPGNEEDRPPAGFPKAVSVSVRSRLGAGLEEGGLPRGITTHLLGVFFGGDCRIFCGANLVEDFAGGFAGRPRPRAREEQTTARAPRVPVMARRCLEATRALRQGCF
jgi:hypothetical protein